MLKKLDYRYKYLLPFLLIFLITAMAGFLLHKNHSKRIYGMPITGTPDSSSVRSDAQKIVISSTGDDRRELELKEGLVEFDIDYSGNTKIAVDVLKRNGDPLAKVVEHNGPCIRKRMVYVPAAGEYVLDVRCEGKWLVSAN